MGAENSCLSNSVPRVRRANPARDDKKIDKTVLDPSCPVRKMKISQVGLDKKLASILMSILSRYT
jgi:hypothetical protein